MADYTIAAGDVAVHAKALAAGVEDTVTLGRQPWADATVLVHPGTTSPVYISTDSTAATVAGGATRVVFPGFSRRVSGCTVVRLICAGTAVYSVQAGN